VTVRRSATVACFLAALSLSPTLLAQTVRVNTPGTAFSAEQSGVTVDDVAGGRRFRGRAFAKVTLRAVLRMPAASAADPKMQRLVIHFRTSPSGPSLRSVELLHPGSTSKLFHIDTHLTGDYIARETITPRNLANAWDWGGSPIEVGSQSVLRLEVQFPGGFDSAVDPGEFFLASVGVDYPRKLIAHSDTTGRVTTGGITERSNRLPPAVLSAASDGVIYAVTSDGDLLWYRHDGHDDGSFRWATAQGKKVGSGWKVRQAFSGGDGVIYAVMANGDLLWNRHEGRADGTFRWASPNGKKVGTGWNFEHVFSGGGGVIYAITAGGDLLWYRHDGRADGSMRWAAAQGTKVGQGWSFKHVFSGGDGVIYAVTADNHLLWYRHDGRDDGSFRWAAAQGKTVGSGWDVRQAFSTGDGVIYAVMSNGDLLWNRHEGRGDGSFRWTAPTGKKVGSGWIFADVF
jgi:hypothetical protein